MFAMYTSGSSSSGFSSYKIISGLQPKCPLANAIRNFETMHKGMQTYMKEHAENGIRKIANENVIKSRENDYISK